MKKALKIYIGISIAGFIGFIAFAVMTMGTPDEQHKAIEEYLSKNADTPVVKNAMLIREMEDLFNYGTKANALGDVFSSSTKSTDSLANGEFKVIVSPNYTYSRNSYPLNTNRYFKATGNGVLKDYYFEFFLKDGDKVEKVIAKAIYEKRGSLDTIEVSGENFEQHLLSTIVNEQRQLVANLKKTKEEEEKRKSQTETQNNKFKESCLSSWDGACPNLERYVKKYLKDPNSYEHIETVFWNKGDYALVSMQYRAKNSFGGYTIGYVKARVSWNCEVLEVLESQ